MTPAGPYGFVDDEGNQFSGSLRRPVAGLPLKAEGKLVSTSAVHLAVTLNVQKVPSEGDQVRASSAVSSPGGGFIIAEGARRQGVRTFLASPLGTGPNSHSIRRSLMASGVDTFDTAFVGDIGVAVTMVEGDGKMAQVVAPGVEAEPTRELLDQIPLEDGDLVHVSGADLVSASGATAIVSWVRDLPAGVGLVVAASPAVGLVPTEVWLQVLARADVVTINIREAALLNVLLKPHVTAEWFQGVVKPTVGIVRRMGPLGCEVIEEGGKKRKTIPAMTARPVDTTGVGDTHVAVMCASLLRGDSLVDACRRANAAAAIEISHATAFPLPSSDAVDVVLATGDARDALTIEAQATFPLRQE